jgi:hypothetical protein
MRPCSEPVVVIAGNETKGITMHVTETYLKIIALGLIPVFFILSAILPKTIASYILLGIVMIAALVVCYLGMSMQKKKEGEEHEDLLAIPPKKL